MGLKECTKVKFSDEAQAENYIQKFQQTSKNKVKPIRSYLCKKCLSWHITTKPNKYEAERALKEKHETDKEKHPNYIPLSFQEYQNLILKHENELKDKNDEITEYKEKFEIRGKELFKLGSKIKELKDNKNEDDSFILHHSISEDNNTLPHLNNYCRIGVTNNRIGLFAIYDIPKGTKIFDSIPKIEVIMVAMEKVEKFIAPIKNMYDDFCLLKEGYYHCPPSFSNLPLVYYMNIADKANTDYNGVNSITANREIKSGEEITSKYKTLSSILTLA